MKLAIRGIAVLTGVAALAIGAVTSTASAAPIAKRPAPAATSAVTPSTVSRSTYVHHKTKRVCGPAKAGHLTCFAIRQTDTKQPPQFKLHAVVPNATPKGYGPSSLDSAYKLSASAGSGQTVAIVDAFDDPNAASDLATYRSQYGLPACTAASGCFRQVNEHGATSPLPTGDTGWAGEESLDVDMVSAICPLCHIILVEANSASNADLGASVNTAVALGAKFVSNSYGGGETSSDISYDSSYYNHPGVAVTASTGDSGYGVEYPAASQYVTAVGGTSLTTASNTRGWTDTAWSGAGSGCSTVDPQPAVQASVGTGCTRRAVADVSAVADPNTGVAVYQTYGGSGWTVYGGTSVSSPIIASVYALAGTPGASDHPNAYPYAHPANLFDVTSGSNGSCSPSQLCTARTGWDGPTGLGTPNGTAAFASGGAPGTLTANNPGSANATVGAAFSLQLSATGGTTPYTWSATGLPAGLAISTAGLISGTPSTAGASSVTATVHDSASHTSSVTFTITVSATGGCASSGQKLGNPGFETGSASPWTSTAGVVNANGAGETSHSGTYYAWLDGYGTTHTDTLSQTVTIPAGCTHSTLTYYLHIDTAETTTTTQYDKLTVTINSTTVAAYSNLNHNTGYTLFSVNAGSFAGQSVAVKFSGTEDSSLQTSFVIDDTALNAS